MRKGQILILMENRTSADVLGPADVWAQRAMSSCPAATAMILLPMSLCSAKVWVSLLVPSRHSLGEARIPRARSGCESSMDQLRKAGGMGVRSIARTG